MVLNNLIYGCSVNSAVLNRNKEHGWNITQKIQGAVLSTLIKYKIKLLALYCAITQLTQRNHNALNVSLNFRLNDVSFSLYNNTIVYIQPKIFRQLPVASTGCDHLFFDGPTILRHYALYLKVFLHTTLTSILPIFLKVILFFTNNEYIHFDLDIMIPNGISWQMSFRNMQQTRKGTLINIIKTIVCRAIKAWSCSI